MTEILTGLRIRLKGGQQIRCFKRVSIQRYITIVIYELLTNKYQAIENFVLVIMKKKYFIEDFTYFQMN